MLLLGHKPNEYGPDRFGSNGMTAIAKEAGLGRESLYKALSPGAKPRYDTILRVLHSLGVRIRVSAA
jgi:probable addiction module antidote protein